MAQIDIADFDFTDRAIAKLWRHGIDIEQLYAVLSYPWIVVRNREDRAASHVLLGTDNLGRCLAIPIAETDDSLIWRPITARYCKPGEATTLRKRRTR
jgi:hypothetical protein